MDWLLKIVVLWLSFDILVMATSWYAVVALKPLFPNWWSRIVAAEIEPEFRVTKKGLRRQLN